MLGNQNHKVRLMQKVKGNYVRVSGYNELGQMVGKYFHFVKFLYVVNGKTTEPNRKKSIKNLKNLRVGIVKT